MSARAPASADAVRLFGRRVVVPKRLRRGTHRAASLTATWRRIAPLLSTVGITRVADLTGLDDLGLPVATAIRANGRSLSSQQGKGATPLAARVSAAMESLETWHAEHLRPTVRDQSLASMRARGQVIDVDRLPGRLPARRVVPRGRPRGSAPAFAGRARFDWLRGWDLVSDGPCWVPTEALSLDCTFAPHAPPRFEPTSNGLASGNHLVEASVHALCELIERDAEARWRAAHAQRRILLETVAGADNQALIAAIERAGSRVVLWDLTSDVGIPVCAALVLDDPRRIGWRPLGAYYGFGCHLEPDIAIGRALTEAAQTRVTYIAGGRDDFSPIDYARSTDPELLAAVWAEVQDGAHEPVDAGDLPRTATATLSGDLRVVRDALVAGGASQIVLVDLTHPRLGVPVVRALVPGRATAVELMG